jgi:sterol desaturase/sphingolipid hydroxylase (fatty acid hydroxylase superfamily)
VRAMRRHHQLHHAPHLMNRRNFNVTVPAWDLVRSTYYRAEPAPGDVALARRPR